MRKKIYFFSLFSIFSVMLFAEEGGGGGWSAVIGSILNSGILWGFLGFLLYKPIVNFFKSKSKEVKEEIDSSKFQKEESEKKLSEIEKRLAKIEDEIEKIKSKAVEDAKKEEEKIKAQLDEDLKRLSELEKTEIESIINSAKAELKKYVLELSLEEAQKKLKGKVDSKLQRKLLDEFIEDLEKIN